MLNVRKLFAICICTLLGGFALGNKNCSAHKLNISLNDSCFRIIFDDEAILNKDYSLIPKNTFEYIKNLGPMEIYRTIDKNTFENFKKVFIPLNEELLNISNHSDYNSDDYIPFTSEIEDSLNEKYIKLFRFIKEQIL